MNLRILRWDRATSIITHNMYWQLCNSTVAENEHLRRAGTFGIFCIVYSIEQRLSVDCPLVGCGLL